MGRLRVLSGRAVCRIPASHGFAEVRRRGSHVVMQKIEATGTVTVPGPDLDTGLLAEFYVETVGLGVVVELHGDPLPKLRSKNALWMVSPSSRVTTRRTRVKASPSRGRP